MHGGTVRAESAGEGRGARFTVLLPACGVARAGGPFRGWPRPPESGDRQAAGARVHEEVPWRAGTALDRPASDVPLAAGADLPSLAGTRVLLVEDEEDTRAIISRILAWRGAEVCACASAREARASLEGRRPDVLVSDIGMPGESGYSLIESVRAMEEGTGTRLPAIALTAYAQETHRLRALASGYDAHVTKPVDPGELVRMVVAMTGPGAPVHRT
jgi:CheY-like chemotaxis protein